MTDLFTYSEESQAVKPASNAHEWTVATLSMALKKIIETEFTHIRVKGEISGFKRHTSGHCYFALKDMDAVIDAVMWKGLASTLNFKPEDGMEVIATGKVTTFAGRSKYQIVVERMEIAGVGALMALLEERKKRLAAEGLFAIERKKPLPYLPQTIGIITSPTGAVIRDIIHRLKDRFLPHVILWAVPVQGEGSAEKIANAIRGFNVMSVRGDIPKVDILIVARGGGSIEDLWAFNEEIVSRAVAESQIPIISAVGHETDTTLIDYVSDRRAPTPTAAAEIAVPVKQDLLFTLHDMQARMQQSLKRFLDYKTHNLVQLTRLLPDKNNLFNNHIQRLDILTMRLPNGLQKNINHHEKRLAYIAAAIRPQAILNNTNIQTQKIQSLAQRLQNAVLRLKQDYQNRLQEQTQLLNKIFISLEKNLHKKTQEQTIALNSLSIRLENLSYKKVLSRGYAVVKNGDNIITTLEDANKKGIDTIEFKDGIFKIG